MTQVQSKGDSKASSAVLVGVGAAAGVAALQSAGAKVSPESTQDISLKTIAQGAPSNGAVPIPSQQPVAEVTVDAKTDASAPSIEELVDAYLEDDDVDALSVEALSDIEFQEHLPEPELLQALVSQPGYQVAQAGGGGGGGGGEGLTGIQIAGYVGGGVAGAYGLNELLDDNDDVATSAS